MKGYEKQSLYQNRLLAQRFTLPRAEAWATVISGAGHHHVGE